MKIDKLLRKRANLIGDLGRVSTFINDFTPDKISQISSRIKICQETWAEFNDVQFEIEGLDDTLDHEGERESFMNEYCENIARLETLVERNKSNNIAGVVDPARVRDQDIKLPPIEVPIFYGAFETWLEFRDIFIAMVDSNSSLSDTQKFYYLKRSLKSDAADVIKSLENSSANYKEAWELLIDTYENKKLIALSHLESLYNFPAMNKESYVSLKKLINQIRNDTRSLKNVGVPVEQWDIILIFFLEMKLDPITRREWKRKVPLKQFAEMNDFIEFLTHKSQYLEAEKGDKVKSNTSQVFNKVRVERPQYSKSLVVASGHSCVICKGQGHDIQNCKNFMDLSVEEKREAVSKERLCWNCLKGGHGARYCKCKGCSKCGRKHHVKLHIEPVASGNREVVENDQEEKETTRVSNVSLLETGYTGHLNGMIQNNENKMSEILLSTVVVDVEDEVGNKHECRALLDCGSQSSFITKDFREKLGLPLRNVNMKILGIGNGVNCINKYVYATIHSRCTDYKFREPFLLIDQISGSIPSFSVNQEMFKIPQGITLGDEHFGRANKVDLLIGAAVFWELLETGKIKVGMSKTFIQNTKLGWVVSGPVPSYGYSENQEARTSACNLSTNVTIQDQLERFWALEEYPKEKMLSAEEQECERSFMQNTTRDELGKFVVALPFKENSTRLGHSYGIAKKRLLNLERKLEKNERMKGEYHDFMKDYERLGHMTKLNLDANGEHPEGEESGEVFVSKKDGGGEVCYLPHHGVFKETSSTTKLRVVFDASSASGSGLSLNNKLLVGPKLQDDIFCILVRFRQHNVVITADIAKMYRQVWVRKDHRDYQRILWRYSLDSGISHYQLNTVTYGMASSSYLAVRCLQELGEESRVRYPMASEVIMQDFYMDDLLTGAESVESAIELKRQVSEILEIGGFYLRKWKSNYKDVITCEGEGIIEHYISQEGDTSRTLGLLWDSVQDILRYEVNLGEMVDRENLEPEKVTKRSILSLVGQVFDPLGLVNPIIVGAKLILQQLWKSKLGWDEEVSEEIAVGWNHFREQLVLLRKIGIPRHVCCSGPREIQVHCFCDASNLAYGACVYLRSTDSDGRHFVHLVCAKSRVAPLKVVSIPRLELCGALLASKLGSAVIEAMGFQSCRVNYWSDSTIVLCWLAGEPVEWVTFVANRTAEIQQLTKGSKWNHVSSSDNPADVVSRGLDCNSLKSSNLWWHGPHWLARDEVEWPETPILGFEIPERRQVRRTLTAMVAYNLFVRYSGWTRLETVIARCLRFIKNCQGRRETRECGPLKVEERQKALLVMVKISQKQFFSSEICCLQNSKNLPHSSKILCLNPFLDEEGILRVGGRLSMGELLSFDQRHPIILANKCHLTYLLIRHEHYKMLHAGAQALLAHIRLKFWPLGGRRTIRGVLKKCLVCFRVKPFGAKQLMGDLPKGRITPSKPFHHCGLDFCGPFETRVRKIRGSVTKKSYICIFVCFATRAVHLELVENLTTEAFMNCFKRFIARRGLPGDIYSDNATNFTGANNEIQKILDFFRETKVQDAFSDYFSKMFIRWHFIPPTSPHFGGLWESAVKSAKYHLKRVVGAQVLSFEELYTVAAQIESCMNSRPLTPLTEDPLDLNVLTPGHFLVGSSLAAFPQENVLAINPGRLKRFQLLTQMVQGFWARWSKEYLSTLQERNKWRVSEKNIKEGTMVLLKDDNLPPLRWPLGRVTQVHAGMDGHCRVVTVKTATGLFKRGISRLCVLPIDDINNDS